MPLSFLAVTPRLPSLQMDPMASDERAPLPSSQITRATTADLVRAGATATTGLSWRRRPLDGAAMTTDGGVVAKRECGEPAGPATGVRPADSDRSRGPEVPLRWEEKPARGRFAVAGSARLARTLIVSGHVVLRHLSPRNPPVVAAVVIVVISALLGPTRHKVAIGPPLCRPGRSRSWM
jgi:hypothetical protein